MDKLIGRHEEQQILKQFLQSKEAEFLAIYGRRRVGKTFLIRNFFNNKDVIFFNSMGSKDAPLSEQIANFMEQIGTTFYQGAILKQPTSWREAFRLLTEAVKNSPKNKKVVLFMDEFPWMATKNSRLLQSLDYYWNQYWSTNEGIKLIICGSSASWIINKIIQNKGGLYNRVTKLIHLAPLDLYEAKRYLNSRKISLNNRQILKIYMFTGGIPYYLNAIEKGYTANQLIEQLAFRKKSFLLKEFETLFASLFENHEPYIDIVKKIASHRYGIGQEELFHTLPNITKGKGGLNRLRALEQTGFIQSFKPSFTLKKGIYYRVIDEFTIFYFKWIEPIRQTLLEKEIRKGYWEKMMQSASWHSWSGYAFESICYRHLNQISIALGLSPTAIPNVWKSIPKKGQKEQGAQIDLFFDRDDDAITICEIKYTDDPFGIDKAYAEKLKQKIAVFKRVTATPKQIFLAMVSANGIRETMYSEEMLDGVVTLDELFKSDE